MRGFRNILSFTAFAMIIAFALNYIASFGVRLGPPDNRTTVHMTVSDLNNLVVGSNVLLRGVAVGKVDRVETSARTATVGFYFDSAYSIPLDSEFRLENLSALGESYISIVPRSSGGAAFTNGQRIATTSVKEHATVSALAADAVRVLNQLNQDQLKRVIDETETALPDGDSILPNLARASALLQSLVTAEPGRGKSLLNNFQELLKNAGFVGPQLAAATPHLMTVGPAYQGAVASALLAVYNSNAPTAVDDFGKYIARIQNFLDTRSPDIKVLCEALLPRFQGIAGSLMNFDTGQMLSNLLDAVPADGSITLHVAIPPGQ